MLIALGELARGSKPAQTFNPGVCRALVERGLTINVLGPAINKRAKPGQTIAYLSITPEGRRRIGA